MAQAHGRELARRGDQLHAIGCMLFWAEGSRDRNCVKLANTDADMVFFFLRFLRECYEVQDDQVALTINCFLNNGLTVDQIEAWWLEKLQLPRSCLRKAMVNKYSKGSRWRRNVHLYGTAHLVVHSTFVVQSIYGAIQEYGGFDRPAWLDIGARTPGSFELREA